MTPLKNKKIEMRHTIGNVRARAETLAYRTRILEHRTEDTEFKEWLNIVNADLQQAVDSLTKAMER